MRISCFRPPSSDGQHHLVDAPRFLSSRTRTATGSTEGRSRFRTRTFQLHRHSSGDSSSSSSKSSSTLPSLPPCPRISDPKIEAMMMPEPADAVPSKCLRLSHPRMYRDIVEDMKSSKGCRDWRNFAVFHDDDVDMTKSANDIARRRARDYARKWGELNSFDSDDQTDRPWKRAS